MTQAVSHFQELIDSIEAMADDDQAALVTIIQKRLQEKHRQELIQQVQEAREDFMQGKIKYGTAADLMKDIESCKDLSISNMNRYRAFQSWIDSEFSIGAQCFVPVMRLFLYSGTTHRAPTICLLKPEML